MYISLTKHCKSHICFKIVQDTITLFDYSNNNNNKLTKIYQIAKESFKRASILVKSNDVGHSKQEGNGREKNPEEWLQEIYSRFH